MAGIGLLLLGTGVTAFGIAPMAPDAATLPVHQVIAIPGWRIKETVLGSPRVVSGRGVSDAVMERAQTESELLSPAQIRKIGDGIEQLCRDVVG